MNNCVHGGWELGCRIDGCQAEYVRVPFADNCLYSIPAGLDYEDVVLVGDVLSTGYFGASLAEIRPGDMVAVIGSGPVGLVSMMCARLYGPARIIASDIIPRRLQVARPNAVVSVMALYEEAQTLPLHTMYGKNLVFIAIAIMRMPDNP